MPSRPWTRRIVALALVGWLVGCSDFSQHRFGGVRRSADTEEGAPKPAPALAIVKPPVVANPIVDPGLKPATFVPDRNPQAIDPKAQGMQHPLRVLYARAAQSHAPMDSYIFRLKRREVVQGKKTPEEIMQIKVRRDPYSVYIKVLAGEGKDREVIYVQGKYNNKMQVLLSPNDFGSSFIKRQSIAPDDALVRSKSRYPITETGLSFMIEHYGRQVAGVERGDPLAGTVKYLGPLDRPEFTGKVEAVYQAVPAGNDPTLPKGGQRWWFFDSTSGLPVLRITHDATGEVEYYCHDHIQAVRLDDVDFNPDRLWRK
jgi:hypothetical protein